MVDITNFDRRWTDKLAAAWLYAKLAVVIVAWAVGIVVVCGIACHLAMLMFGPLFRFGWDVIPTAQRCLGGICEMVVMR